MRRNKTIKQLLMILALSSTGVSVSAMETEGVELSEGFIDKKTGIRVEKIITRNDMKEITVSIPKSNGKIAEDIDEIIITAPAPDKSKKKAEKVHVKQGKKPMFIKDFNNDRYGLVIFLGKNSQVPLRLFFDIPSQEP